LDQKLTLGKAIRNAREQAGLSQETVAAKARIGRSYLSLLEHDAKSPTVKVLLRVCSAIGVKAADVLSNVERKGSK
jgi:transcriptional regulator with XRE-family HTH domain